VKNVIEILMGIAFSVSVAFSNTAIFTILIMPIEEHKRSFCFPVSDFIFQWFIIFVGEVSNLLG
jgi:hypothetical protein